MPLSGRIYTMSAAAVTLSAAQDLLAVYAGTTKKFALLGFNIGQVTNSVVVNAKVRLIRLPATVTTGSSGSAGVLKPYLPGDASATITGRINDTTQATTGGTAEVLWAGAWSTLNNLDWYPPANLRPPVFDLSQALIVSLDTALGSYVTSASITVEEI